MIFFLILKQWKKRFYNSTFLIFHFFFLFTYIHKVKEYILEYFQPISFPLNQIVFFKKRVFLFLQFFKIQKSNFLLDEYNQFCLQHFPIYETKMQCEKNGDIKTKELTIGLIHSD